jgi:zinc transport system substrate-binding protein
MKKLLALLLFISFAMAKVDICVSILPQQTFVKKITKDLANVYVMVPRGSSPHSYEPKPSQMKHISSSKVYFTIDVEFEEAWLDRFKAQNRDLLFVDVDQGIQKSAMQKHSHHDDEHKEHKHEAHHDHDDHDDHEAHDEHNHKGLDPHIWTSPKNVKIIAKNIYETLIKIDSKNEKEYTKNYKEFLAEIDATDKTIKDLLSKSKNKKFMVFHPAWGYYAKEYHLEQMAIEVSGKSPKMKEMIELIKEAKEHDIKTVFTHPEFSDKSAKLIAKELGATVIKVSPLAPNWSANLIKITKAIANWDK